jgi:hypothetical protein
MSVNELIESVRRTAEAGGLRLPLAKARNAVSFMLYGANYSAVLAAEKAGKAPAPSIDERRALASGSRYRFDSKLILQAARVLPMIGSAASNVAPKKMSERTSALLPEAGVRESRGHTCVHRHTMISARTQHDQLADQIDQAKG